MRESTHDACLYTHQIPIYCEMTDTHLPSAHRRQNGFDEGLSPASSSNSRKAPKLRPSVVKFQAVAVLSIHTDASHCSWTCLESLPAPMGELSCGI